MSTECEQEPVCPGGFLFSKSWITSNNTQKVTTIHTTHGEIPVCRLLLLTSCLYWVKASSVFFFFCPNERNKNSFPHGIFLHCLLSQMLSALSFFYWTVFPGIKVFQNSWKASNNSGILVQLSESRSCRLRYFHLVSLPSNDPCPFKTFFRAFIFAFWEENWSTCGVVQHMGRLRLYHF